MQAGDARSTKPVELSPGIWRSQVRALLRTDLYGDDGHTCASENCNGGLRGIIAEMEARQEERHHQLDALNEAGLWPLNCEKLLSSGLANTGSNQNRFCLQMVGAAKKALEALVIA